MRIIRGSANADEARAGLMANFGLSEEQAKAILDMRLARLTGLERQKIDDERAELMKEIAHLEDSWPARRWCWISSRPNCWR